MIYVLTMAHNSARVMMPSLERCYETATIKDKWQHVILDAHYPIDRPAVEHFLAEYKQRGAIILDAGKNMGLHKNWNWMCEQLPLQPEDILIGLDPDSWPVQTGWDAALVQALQNWKETKIPWVSVMSDVVHHLHNAQFKMGALNGLTIRQPVGHPCWMQSICAFVWEPLKAIGNFDEPFEYFGDLEKTIHPKYLALGYDMAWLEDFWDEPRKFDGQEDREYFEFKMDTAMRGTYNGDFETYIKMKRQK